MAATLVKFPEEFKEQHIPLTDSFSDRQSMNVGFVEKFSYRVVVSELRLQKIKRLRNMFSVLTLFLAAVAATCFYVGGPYQPFVATGIATLGSTVVLWMKAAGK